MMQSLVNDAEQSGWLPRWPAANDVTYVMNGDSPSVLIASAYAFGARNFDTKTALKYMVKARNGTGQWACTTTKSVPILPTTSSSATFQSTKIASAASRTLEYASDDFAIAQFARGLGDTATYQRFLEAVTKLDAIFFDPETRWIRPRNSDGSVASGL